MGPLMHATVPNAKVWEAACSGKPCSSWRPNGASGRLSSQVRTNAGSKEITLLDYGAGNVRSVKNAVHHLGYTFKEVG